MTVITEIEDLRRIYRRRVPRMFVDYCESGSWSEATLRANRSAFDEILFRQRVAVDITGRSTATTICGQPAAIPVGLAPVGLLGMQHADGEILAARAAEDFGVPFCLSTLSICSIEDVAARTAKPFWFQVYTLKDDDFMRRLFARARDAGVERLVITLDLQLQGQRHADWKNGLTAPPRPTLRNAADIATRIPWAVAMLSATRRTFGNVVGHAKGVSDTSSLMEWTGKAFDQSLDWDRVKELRSWWDGPVTLKGILDERDARRALDCGADAVVVSNHGGRQLDHAQASLRALPAILDAVGDRAEVHLDGGIRSGQDVLKAVALGARAAWIGRAFVYGLGAMGRTGVTTALEVIRKELDMTMALTGRRDVASLDNGILMVPRRFTGEWA